MAERNFEFRRLLNQVHRPGRRDPNRRPAAGEVVIDDGWCIAVAPDAGEYLVGVARDLEDYLFCSQGVSVRVVRAPRAAEEARTIRLTCGDGAPELSRPRSYRLIVKADSVVVCGFDERGIAQGCYWLEDLMNLREAPYLERQDVVREPVFSPRMVHSGWGIDQFPDPHLHAIAHSGMDAILVFVKGPDLTTTGYLDLNNLVDRAALAGLDVYLYSYLVSEMHPAAPGAREYYEGTYGNLVRACPGAKGIVFVGESCEFPSRDEHTTGKLRLDPTVDRSVDHRPSPGWWPCFDYPEWLDLLKPILRQVNPELDIVFWTYNWGWAPEEDRLALIRTLPTDISLQATFEMFENVVKDGVVTRCVDYTASFEGPGVYFRTEAATAHERGIPLYTMSNTGGLTWDIGVIPYEPVPFHWARRWQALLTAHAEWGLVGLMESHHYGWWPSIVSELAKWAYWTPAVSIDDMAARIAERDFGSTGGPLAVQAWQAWSEAIRDYVPTNEDQYGPFRVGPAYPLVFEDDCGEFPDAPYAHFGNEILSTNYGPHQPDDVPGEIRLLERMASRWAEGVDKLAAAVAVTPEGKLPAAQRMLGLGRFILNCVRTTIHTKQWWLAKQRLAAAAPAEAGGVLDELVSIAEAERGNVLATIPLVEADSRLGWEPSMEYMTDRPHLEWKLAQLQHVLAKELPACRQKLTEGGD